MVEKVKELGNFLSSLTLYCTGQKLLNAQQMKITFVWRIIFDKATNEKDACE